MILVLFGYWNLTSTFRAVFLSTLAVCFILGNEILSKAYNHF